MAITSTQQTEILKVVAGLFNAAPGGSNLSALAGFIEGGNSIRQLADALAANTLFTNGVMAGKVVTADQVAVLMNNFGLTFGGAGSADTQAQAYFTQQIDAGVGFGEIVYTAVTYLSGSPAAEFADTAALLANKALVAEVYSHTNSSSDLGVLQSVLIGVTATGPATEADALAFLADKGIGDNPGQTFTLTNGADTILGTSGDDLISGEIDENANIESTLNASDVIDGGAGYDTLRIGSNGDGSEMAMTASSITNVERLLIVDGDDDFDSLDLAGRDFELVEFQAPGTGSSVTAEAVALGTAFKLNGWEEDLTVEFAGASGSSDSADVEVANIEDTGTGTIDVQGIETLNLLVSADSYLDDITNSTSDLGTLVISGAGALEVGSALDGATVSVDASANTGGVTLDFGSATADLTVVGSAGDDSLTFGAGQGVDVTAGAGDDVVDLAGDLANATNVDGGDGVDQIGLTVAELTAITADQADLLLNFETLRVSDALGAATIDMDDVNNYNNIVLAAGVSGAGVINNVADGATITYLGDNGAGNLTVGDSTDLNVELSSDDGAASQDYGIITSTTATSMSIASNAGDTTTANIIDITANIVLETLTLTGDADLDLSGIALDNTALETVDASAMTGAVTVAVAGGVTDMGVAITGGSGDDVLTGGDSEDTIIGGDGDDTISGGLGIDALTGGDGADTFDYNSDAESQGVTVDVIADFVSGTDVLDFNGVTAGVGTYLGEASGYGAVLTSLTNTAGDAVLDSTTNTLYVDVDGSGTLDNSDIAITLTGVTNLDTADIVF